MINMRKLQKQSIDLSGCDFTVPKRGEEFDFTVRLLGAAKGKLAILPDVRTTTISIKAKEGKLDRVLALFQSIELTEEDFFYSVSVPYVDKYDFLQKVVDLQSSTKIKH